MDVRTIKRRITAMKGRRASRPLVLAGSVCLFLGTSVLAQNTFEFIDPLDEERIRVERAAESSGASPSDRWRPAVRAEPDGAAPRAAAPPAGDDPDMMLLRARDEARANAAALRDESAGFWSRMRTALSSVATAINLPLAGLVALLFALLAGLAALIGWTLFRSRGKYDAPYEGSNDSDVYARTPRSSQKRRDAKAAPVAASARPDDFEESMPEDFDAILAREHAEAETSAPVAPGPAAAPDPEDTSTWRKPNLDRLRDSIKSDWKASKQPPAPAPVPAPLPTETSDEDRSLSDISDGWEDWDAQDKPEDDPWGETLAPATTEPKRTPDDEALRRIRALRQSLRAS